MKHFKILVWLDSLQVKWYVKSSTEFFVYELPHELLNDFRLRILETLEIMEKKQKWVEAEPSTQSSFQKENFGTGGQKLHKSRFQSFSSCPVFPDSITLFY